MDVCMFRVSESLFGVLHVNMQALVSSPYGSHKQPAGVAVTGGLLYTRHVLTQDSA